MTEGKPEPTPEGALIGRAMIREGVNAPEVARAAGISAGRWRHIVNAAQPLGGGRYNRVVAPAATLARMARAVAVTPVELEEAGRPDAADILRDLIRDPSPTVDRYRDPDTGESYVDEDERRIWDLDGITVAMRRSYIYQLRADRAAGEPPERRRAS